MLKCRDVAERASEYIDHELSWRGYLAVRLHLLMCRVCREYVRQLSLVAHALQHLPADEVTSDRP
ncbi:MAG TPA: zf-HC2 domain-containing protein [Vicinamibacterales bacterium]|nr:zf-HC2 domain-containing protein [Vicinamibacterales bacterium]